MTTDATTEQRRRHLRVGVKLLLAVGLLFLLVPFVKSLPWLQETASDPAALLGDTALAPGETRKLPLAGGGALFVTRSSPALAARLRNFPEDLLWFPPAPGLTDQPWFVLGERSALDEPIRFLPAQGVWPGGFVADSGSAWDVAGRALKPWPGHPTGYAVKVMNLQALPYRQRGDGIELPAPLAAETTTIRPGPP